MFCLLLFCLPGLILASSLRMGAPTNSGGLILLLKFFALGSFEIWSDLFTGFPMLLELPIFLLDSPYLLLLVKFLGFSISWKDGLGEVLMFEVVLLIEVFLLWSIFCEGLFSKFWFRRLVWFEIIFICSGLFRGLINEGFFELFCRVFPFSEEITGVLSSIFFWWLSFLIEGLLIESIFLSEFFLLIRFFIFFASPALIELLWLFTEIESFWAASNISLFSRFKSLESS